MSPFASLRRCEGAQVVDMELIFVTSNTNKLREASAILGRELSQCDWT